MFFSQPCGELVLETLNNSPCALALRLGRTLPQCVLMLCIGCSASQQIATSASEINKQAEIIRDQANQLQLDGEQIHSKIIIASADKIISEISDIHASIPKIKDLVPWWVGIMQLMLVAVLVVGGIVLLWQTGIGQAIKIGIGWLPKNKLREASLLQNVLADESPETIREFIAVKRASDPMLDAAWKASKK